VGGASEKMKLSIIICAYNEEKGMGALLRNLSKQKMPPEIVDHEILVVASGCTDGTIPQVKEFMAKNPKVKLIVEDKRLGKASALNKAMRVATGQLLALIPADVLPVENGLYHLLLPLRDPKVSVVSGRPVDHPKSGKKGLVGYLGNMTYRLWEKLMKTLNDSGLAVHCSGEFMAMRAGIIEKIPEECVAEDSYISVLARKSGSIKFAPKAVAYNSMPSNIPDYINQRRRWLYGHFQTRKLTGVNPTVLDTIIFSKTKTALKILIQEIVENLKGLPFLLAATLIECVIYFLAALDLQLKRQYAIWPVIKSTKVALDV
jgi:cellulose synthase/poly-beta-1,6-N-acetylglucosamine synthase-like glycosyltransferase